jgi:hypothetical protein
MAQVNEKDEFKAFCVTHNEKKVRTDIPIVLIDNSGSTDDKFKSTSRILKKEVAVAKSYLTKSGYTECYIMYWNTSVDFRQKSVKVSELEDDFKTHKIKANGGTDISVAINAIPNVWYQEYTNIIIITDGEVNADKYKFNSQVFNLTKRKVDIKIITVESNNRNYLDSNVNAGATIYSTIQTNKLAKYIRSFECYNEHHENEPFVNFYNPIVKKGEFSFKEWVFPEDKFDNFTKVILKIINANVHDKKYLEKIMYHLSFTIYQYTKHRTQKVKNEVVRLFTSLFEEAFEDAEYVRNIFESEMVNHEEGTSKTFQQYKENRQKLFERTQEELYSNVKECFAKGKEFVSFIIKTTTPEVNRVITSNEMDAPIRLSDLYFNNGGIKYSDYNIPMFSCSTVDSESAEQAVRQWVRAIYSRVHNMQANDERILYLFLTDMMSIVLSDLPVNVKFAYKNCARIMLNAVRFNSGGINQVTWLTMGNKPKPMIPGYFTMEEILTYCKNYYNPNLTISLDEFWYGVCWAFGFDKVIKKQIPDDYDIKGLVEKLTSGNKKYKHENINVVDSSEYYDYITLQDTSLTGGYKLPEYKLGTKTFNVKFVISPETFQLLKSNSANGKTTCPVTGRLLDLDSFVKVEPHANKNAHVFNCEDFSMEIFNKTKYEKVPIDKFDTMKITDLEIKPADQYDWTKYPYEFTPKVPIITEKLYKEKTQYRTSAEFKNQVVLRYNWLTKLPMENLAIAGGFCKSLIFDEKVNDIDLYMYGFDTDAEYNARLEKLVGDLNALIIKEHPNSVSLRAYKKEFNVYELMYFENIKDVKKDTWELQDLTQMKFIVKIQIIMKKHKEMKEIFNDFDLDSCCVLYNGTDLYFSQRSYIAYKYLINIPRVDNFFTVVFDLRLLKYYDSGFRIILPRTSVEWITKKMGEKDNFVIGRCKFFVNSVEGSNVYITKTELIMVKEVKPVRQATSIYSSIIGDVGSLDDSRSIVKFMKYVQRQNRIVERVKKNADSNVVMTENQLFNAIDEEMKEELTKLNFANKTNIKSQALLAEDDDYDTDSDVEEDTQDNAVSVDDSDVKVVVEPVVVPVVPVEADEVVASPESYIKVYFKVCGLNDVRKINEFDNGVCELVFIFKYEDYHKQFDWYSDDAEVRNAIVEEEIKKQKELAAKNEVVPA